MKDNEKEKLKENENINQMIGSRKWSEVKKKKNSKG